MSVVPRSLRLQLALKRALDVTVALGLLVVLGPLMFAIGAAISLTSPGGPFFLQTRAGRDGRPFTIHKFRTMTPEDPAAATERYSYEKTAARVTPIGQILRRLSLDELPQLVDILKGDMSLVGPRPDTIRHAEAYTDEQRLRLSVQPGVTGLAQISGRNALTWQERIDLDVEYAERWSLALDLLILVRTARVVLTGKGTELPRGAR